MTMQKTDAELIAEANDWAAELLSEDCGHTSQMIVELARRLKAANERIEKADEIICGQLTQACNWGDGNKLDHKFLSAYEDAQYYLIETGRITQDDCKNK